MARGAPLVKENHSTSQIDGKAHLQGQLLSYKRLDGATPPSDRLTCWDEVTFLHCKRCYLLLVFVDFDWKFCPFLLLHHEAKFGRVYPLQTIAWSERGDLISGDHVC